MKRIQLNSKKRSIVTLIAMGAFSISLTESASAALWQHLNPNNSSVVNSSNWNLTSNGITYDHIDKNGQEQKPALPVSINYGGGNRSVRLWTAALGQSSSSATDKSEYLIMTHSHTNSVYFPGDSRYKGDYYGGVAFRLDKNYFSSIEGNTDRRQSLLFFQCWQNSGRGPALSIQFAPWQGNNNQKLWVVVRDDAYNNASNTGHPRLEGIQPTIVEDRWYVLTKRLRPSYPGDYNYGHLSVWLKDTTTGSTTTVISEGSSARGDSFEWGFVPSGITAAGVTGNASGGMTYAIAVYRQRQNREHRMFFDKVKYGNSLNDVQP